MKRRMAMLVAVSAVAGVMTMFAPTTSAQAVPHGACAGTGTAKLTSPLVYPFSANDPNPGAGPANPGFSSAKSTAFVFHFVFPTGVCVNSAATLANVSATGSVHGFCGLSVGRGTSNLGDDFRFVGVGGTLVVTGEVVGIVNAAPNALLGSTCLDHQPGATDFLINGVVVQNSCAVQVTVSTSVTLPSPLHGTLHPHVSCV